MAMHVWAFLLIGGMAVGNSATDESGKKPAAGKLPLPAPAGDLQLEKAARDFRIQTYEMFRNDRAEFDRREAEAARLRQAWTDAGADPDDQPKLIHWFEQAAAGSDAGAIGELPPAPQFVTKPPKERKKSTDDEKQLADTSGEEGGDKQDVDNPTADKPIIDPAASHGHWQVQPAGSTTASAHPQTKSTPISTLPNQLGSELSHAIDRLSGAIKQPPTK